MPEANLFVTRKDFDYFMQDGTPFSFIDHELEPLGTIVAGESEVTIREQAQGYLTGRWARTRILVAEPLGTGWTRVIGLHPPLASCDKAAVPTWSEIDGEVA